MKIRKEDQVKILTGKDQGKTGKVLKVFAKEGKALVEGVNIVKKHLRKKGQVEGGIIDLPKPLSLSNIALVCPACNQVTKVGFKVEGKNKTRICKKCQEVIKTAAR